MTEIKFTKQTLLKEEWRVRKVRIRMNILTSWSKIFEVKVNVKTEKKCISDAEQTYILIQ